MLERYSYEDSKSLPLNVLRDVSGINSYISAFRAFPDRSVKQRRREASVFTAAEFVYPGALSMLRYWRDQNVGLREKDKQTRLGCLHGIIFLTGDFFNVAIAGMAAAASYKFLGNNSWEGLILAATASKLVLNSIAFSAIEQAKQAKS